ncbi:MAG: hypothetical protein HHJ15_04085 [Rhodoferax sp.]|uniref:hypothetical protein n=1 Tax=Rhodoferax sp. TaxID=50421 RepID=UPI0017BF41D3|nr:hypothetical protein [Rhodoferax sp.]NMM19130.1 hypothetical protein [Rhodoferax sp.]
MAEITIEQIEQREYARLVFADTRAEYAAGLVYCAFLKTQGVNRVCVYKDQYELTHAWVRETAAREFSRQEKRAARRGLRAAAAAAPSKPV